MKKFNFCFFGAGALAALAFISTATATEKPLTFKCPTANQIIITGQSTSTGQSENIWMGPYSELFGISGQTYPQYGSKALGNAIYAKAEPMGPWTDYVCYYPTNATTPDHAPYTAYIFYQSASRKDCKVVITTFVCPN